MEIIISDIDDDDFEIIPPKIAKLDDSINQSEACIICLEYFTVSGDHKIVSLKCGHIFGEKCITMWLGDSNKVCPTCKGRASKKDIHPVFIDIPTLKIIDNTELISTSEQLQKTKIKLIETELQCSYLQSQCNGFIIENKKLRDENILLKQRNLLIEHQNNQSDIKIPATGTSFNIVNRLLISQEGDCRVMAYSELNNTICVSTPSANTLYPGFGVRTVSVKHGKLMKFHHLHTKMIRDIAFSPYNTSDLMLTCSLDKYIKLTSLKAEKTVSSYLCSLPLWSCAWSNNGYIFYAGLANGTVEELDTRNLTNPVSKVWSQPGGPVLSMRYVCGNKHISNPGLLVTNSKNVLFLEKKDVESNEEEIDNSERWSKTHTLLLSSNYGGSIIHTTFNDRTSHLLSTFRPLTENKSQFLLSQIGSTVTNDSNSIYSSDTKSFFGGTKKEFMHRSCFIDDEDSVNKVVCPDEESCSIKIYDPNSADDCVTFYPKDVSRQKPILDVCQYSSSPLSFCALNSHYLYFYSQ